MDGRDAGVDGSNGRLVDELAGFESDRVLRGGLVDVRG